MDNQPDNDIVGEIEHPIDEQPEAPEEAATTQTVRHPLAWENYLRCFFLMAIIFTIGLLSWRPGLLRFSLIMSFANPSRGDSLAWTPEPDPLPQPAQAKRAPSPDEWRLESAHSATWIGNRPRARQDSHAGGRLDASRWRRFSTNPWRWSDDSQASRQTRKPDDASPPQKSATEFRAGNLPDWPQTDAMAATGGFSTSLRAPALEGVPPLLPQTGQGAGVGLPGTPGLPALPGSGTTPSLPGLPSLPPPVSSDAGATSLPEARPAQLFPTTQSQTSPTRTVEPQPAVAEEKPEDIDWTNREITGPIPGAYLTIYPKLKFIGLCLPNLGYIRKYNQVGVPRESEGAKLDARDGRTPYGRYYIADRQRDSDGPRLYLSWPSPEDAQRIGLDPGKVAEIEHAWRSKILPPQDTAAGGGIALNGLRNWVDQTDGGFTLEEPQIEEIFTALPEGAWVFVQP